MARSFPSFAATVRIPPFDIDHSASGSSRDVGIGKHDGIASRISTNHRAATTDAADSDTDRGPNHLLEAVASLGLASFLELMIFDMDLLSQRVEVNIDSRCDVLPERTADNSGFSSLRVNV